MRTLASLSSALLLLPSSGCSNPPPADAGSTGGQSASGGTVGAGGAPAAGGGSSPSGGAGTGGANAFFGDSRCSTDLSFCDGFEAPTWDTERWTAVKTGETALELTLDQAARGERSLHIHAAGGFGYLSHSGIFPLANNAYYGRLFLRVARYSTVAWAHWTVAEAAGTGDGSLIRVGGQYVTDQAKNRWGVGSDGGPTGDWTAHDTDPDGAPLEPPTNTWTCVEWRHDGASDITQFFIDGVEHPSLATTASSHGGSGAPYQLPEMTSVWVGWYQYQPDPLPFDVWIDEVAFDDERIGCER